jgi:hypothetical protein
VRFLHFGGGLNQSGRGEKNRGILLAQILDCAGNFGRIAAVPRRPRNWQGTRSQLIEYKCFACDTPLHGYALFVLE